jgi:hypothetical protein
LPHKADSGVTPRDVAFGRVEDERGCLGPMANAPFPIPAQSGRVEDGPGIE